ncbi:MAG TPA: M23 family metallopeptidase [Flavisolibacter sp.]|nr:M23 family metallopeptidase [Flavisolibacter sp.]
MKRRLSIILTALLFNYYSFSQPYPENYFRTPLNIPMQLVANFGEIRPNHWHMGLDIRTQHRLNLPVYSASEGYIARVSITPEGFGQAIYINHPNGMTTVYGHLNSFIPALAKYVKQQQYLQQSWSVDLKIPSDLFPVKKGQLIALSGSTGGSEGPHLHFEIRDTKSGNNLNPLLFHLPIADNVPPTLLRLALYDRNKSTYEQMPKIFALKKAGANYTLSAGGIMVNSNKISFAIGANDRLSNSNNPNGIYSARIFMDGHVVSEFTLNNISYDDTRYINAQVDYHYKNSGGNYVQHISPLPGDHSSVYKIFNEDGLIHLEDTREHLIVIEVRDAYQNKSRLQFNIQYLPGTDEFSSTREEQLIPNNVNIFERDNFELNTTENTIYDTVTARYAPSIPITGNSISNAYSFLNESIPVHDEVTVRIKQTATETGKPVMVNILKGKNSVSRAEIKNGWVMAKFRQFGTFQAFSDNEPPTINAPGTGDVIDLSKKNRLVFIPKDNYKSIRSFRAEIDGQWLCFTNDKGRVWIYSFEEHFPRGVHELKLTIEDEAGNVSVKRWKVKR